MSRVEVYKLPQGKIFIVKSNKNFSTGVLSLLPHTIYPKHNRPVTEQLTQVIGTSTIKLLDGDKVIKRVRLKEGDHLTMKPNQYHIHSNLTSKESVTIWRFDGDITKVISSIRNTNKKLK